jgi:PPK2 family polyphosphate:nucleotide phosphotransferase
MGFEKKLRVRPDFRIDDLDADSTPGIRDKKQAARLLETSVERLFELQYDLYAEGRRSLLLVFQAMDAGGKDGTIRTLAHGLNPLGCRVASFKAPSLEEATHDFLWRVHLACPGKGEVGVFNRSHYEDVLVVRVEELLPKPVWSKRYDQINTFERYLVDNDVTILKFYLHISKDEQKRRMLERLDDPRKLWKFSPRDLAVRKQWDEYMKAYEVALRRCNTDHAPWYAIPANHNWYRNAVVASIVTETLERMKPRFPRPKIDRTKIRL